MVIFISLSVNEFLISIYEISDITWCRIELINLFFKDYTFYNNYEYSYEGDIKSALGLFLLLNLFFDL